MLSDIITDIVTSQADMEIVGTLADPAAIAATVAETNADVVVLGLPDADLPAEYAALLNARAQIRLLGVSGDGRRAFLYDLRPYRSALGEGSPQRLAAAIREAVPQNWQPDREGHPRSRAPR